MHDYKSCKHLHESTAKYSVSMRAAWVFLLLSVWPFTDPASRVTPYSLSTILIPIDAENIYRYIQSKGCPSPTVDSSSTQAVSDGPS